MVGEGRETGDETMTRAQLENCTTDQLKKCLSDMSGMKHHPFYQRVAGVLEGRTQ